MADLIFIKAVKVLWIMKKLARLQPVCRCLVWTIAHIIFNGQFFHCNLNQDKNYISES